MRKSNTYLLALTLFVAGGCKLDDARYVPVHELACVFLNADGSYVSTGEIPAASAEGGSVQVRILSNGDVTLVPEGDALPDWMHVEGAFSFNGDATITATMENNEGFRRGAKFTAIMDGAQPVEFVIRQNGVTPYLGCDARYKTAKGSMAGSVSYPLVTNIAVDELTVEKTDQPWISGIAFSGTALKVDAVSNPESHSRKASFAVSYQDGWGVMHQVELFLTQASAQDTFGTPVSFEKVRSQSTPSGASAEADLTLSGIVVSDYRSANMEENPVLKSDEAPQLSNSHVSATVRETVMQVVDTTASARTAYFESPDGQYGFRLVFSDPEDNRLAFGTALTLSLDGLSLVREEDPERYTIYGLKPGSLIETIPGQIVPVKEKRIASLTDEDLYTFVGIQDVEFPVKEGSYTDIRENHALWSEVNDQSVSPTDSKRYFYMDGYANLLLDNEGKGICAPVNMLCRWRKPSGGIPQGAGTASGVLVHNDIPRYGDAGKYQLRVIDESGFSPLSGTASAWTEIAAWDKGSLMPSRGNATMSCTKTGASIADEHSYKSRVAATGRTCGISDTYRSLRVNSPVNGWYNWTDDGSVSSYNGLVIALSTKALSGRMLSLALRFYAGRSGTASTFQAFPSHWCAEFSLDGGESWILAQNADLSGNAYVHLRSIATYTLQYGSYKIPTTVSSGLGASEHVFCFPAEVFGKDQILLRIRPFDTVMTTLPSLFSDPVEVSAVTASTSVQDYVSFQDIVIRYR